jgi:ribonucleotide monophosphatase NagD (HAD superfamily)
MLKKLPAIITDIDGVLIRGKSKITNSDKSVFNILK